MSWTPEQLTRVLNEAADIEPEVDTVLKRGAHKIKGDARSFAVGQNPRHASGFPYSIEYQKKAKLSYEIEPKDGAQGALGAILEFGGVHSGPQHNLKTAAEKEEPQVEKYLMQAVVKKLW